MAKTDQCHFPALISLIFPPGHLFSHQPSCRYLPGRPRGEGVTEWHHPLCRAIHQGIRHQQGPLPFLFTSHPEKQQHAIHFFCLFWLVLILCSLPTDGSEGAQSCQADMPALGPVQDAVRLGCQVRHESKYDPVINLHLSLKQMH